METDDVEKLLDATAGRDEQIVAIVRLGWSFSEVSQALDVTPGIVAGVMKRRRDKRAA